MPLARHRIALHPRRACVWCVVATALPVAVARERGVTPEAGGGAALTPSCSQIGGTIMDAATKKFVQRRLR